MPIHAQTTFREGNKTQETVLLMEGELGGWIAGGWH